MPVDSGPVVILYRGHLLAEALAPGLLLRGWLPRVVDQDAPDAVGADLPVVLCEDNTGQLPGATARVPALTAGTGRGLVVVVAGRAALAAVTRAVAAGATAVSADQPYRSLLLDVHEALAAGHDTREHHQRLLADLRERAEEANRFATLTARERAVLVAIATGMNAEAIAASRPVGLATVRSQIAAVLRKLGVASQVSAVALTSHSCADPRITEPLRQFHQKYG